MDEAIFAIGAIGFFLIGPWILVWLGRRRRLREREEDRARWGQLTQRIYLLEHAVEQLKKSPPAVFVPSVAAEPETPISSKNVAAAESIPPTEPGR